MTGSFTHWIFTTNPETTGSGWRITIRRSFHPSKFSTIPPCVLCSDVSRNEDPSRLRNDASEPFTAREECIHASTSGVQFTDSNILFKIPRKHHYSLCIANPYGALKVQFLHPRRIARHRTNHARDDHIAVLRPLVQANRERFLQPPNLFLLHGKPPVYLLSNQQSWILTTV